MMQCEVQQDEHRPLLMTYADLVVEFQMSERQIRKLVKANKLPQPFDKIPGRTVRWLRKDIEEFLGAAG